MSKPRIHILALGGTIATRPDASGAMQMGLGADDLVAAVPLLGRLAEIEAETVSRVGSHSLVLRPDPCAGGQDPSPRRPTASW